MDGIRKRHRRSAGYWGLAIGVLTGATTVVLASAAVAQQVAPGSPEPLIEATHLPPLLTAAGERIELRYNVYCTPTTDSETDQPCDATGSVFVRTGDSGSFQGIPLRADAASTQGKYVAVVPNTFTRSRTGFSYYAIFRDASSGVTTTIPSGGATSPQRSLPLGRSIELRLVAHSFGQTRAADERVAEARWGSGPGEAGLEQGRNLPPIGATAFDVDADGMVHVLDEANRRLLRWRTGARSPENVPLAIQGTLADLSVADDGTIYVLETATSAHRSPVLRAFGENGAAQGSAEVAERAAVVRVGPNGPVVLQQPSGQWMAAAGDGRMLAPADQRRSGRSGRPLRGGGEVVVLRHGNEVRVAEVGPNGVRRAWRLTGETPLAEVQLAEPLGNRLVLVVRVYTDDRDEFLVLVLDQSGVVRRLSVDSADWAETAPLSRFRLVGSSLYQLGSTPAGLFVDRFDLEVK